MTDENKQTPTPTEPPKITKPKDPRRVEQGKRLAEKARERREQKAKELEKAELEEKLANLNVEQGDLEGEYNPGISTTTIVTAGTALALGVLYFFGKKENKTPVVRVSTPPPPPQATNYDSD